MDRTNPQPSPDSSAQTVTHISATTTVGADTSTPCRSVDSHVTTQQAVDSHVKTQQAVDSHVTTQQAVDSHMTTEQAVERHAADPSAGRKSSAAAPQPAAAAAVKRGETSSSDVVARVKDSRRLKSSASLSPQRKGNDKKVLKRSDSNEDFTPQREYKISEALKQTKQQQPPPPLASLQVLAKKASSHGLHEAGGAVAAAAGASGGDHHHRPRPSSARLAASAAVKSPTTAAAAAISASAPGYAIAFTCGNPSVEVTEGIIHLYRDDTFSGAAANYETVCESQMICFMSVPARMTSHDLIQFLAPVEDWIEHIKVLRADGTPNQYMLLVKFRTHRNALDFYKNFNNKPFNSLEKDLCSLAFVSRLEAVKAEDGACLPIAGNGGLRLNETVDRSGGEGVGCSV